MPNTVTQEAGVKRRSTRALKVGVQPLLRLVPGKGSAESISNHYSDMGNAAYMRERHGANLRFVPKWEKWFIWNGKFWEEDGTFQVYAYAKDTVISMYADAAKVPDEKRGEFIKHVRASERERSLMAMVELLKSEPNISIIHEVFDADDMLLNCENGTLELRTGTLREHRREDFIRKMAPVVYDSTATAPKWGEFLDTVMCGESDLVQFLQEVIGVSLTGTTSDKVFMVLHGAQGDNGKTTFLETIKMLLGEYAQTAPTSTFIKHRDNGINNDVARLVGARFVSASETEEGQHLADSRIKELSGGDTMTARFLHHENFSFKPKATLFLATNHRPRVRNGDNALWKRMRLVPFKHSFSANPMDMYVVLDGFKQELSGILNWALAGWAARQARGHLFYPEVIKKAVAEYRASSDVIGMFLADKCVRHPQAKVPAQALYDAYKVWCHEKSEHEKDNAIFAEHLIEQCGFERVRKTSGNFYLGLGFRSEYDLDEEPVTQICASAPVEQAAIEVMAHAAPRAESVHVSPSEAQEAAPVMETLTTVQRGPKPPTGILCPDCHQSCTTFDCTFIPPGYACPSCHHFFRPKLRYDGSVEQWQ